MAPRSPEIVLLLLVVLASTLSAEAKGNKTLTRKKREWILPPSKLMENVDYTKKEFIAKIRSDKDRTTKVEYYLSGAGADKPPINLFLVDHDTGLVTITGILDREKYPSYNLTGVAKYRDGSAAEENIPLTVTVLDQNDNAPYIELHTGSAIEASKTGTYIMQVVGKDDDQAGTINSEISYSIISQEPAGTGHMFTIDEKTGKVYVKEPTLDRETNDNYKLVVMGRDLGGAPGGLSGTGTVEIKVVDINDNIPTLEKSEYTGSVDENVADIVVMRIKALDKDLENSDNWLTIFSFAKGNEDNLFSIETDRETNEGILKLIKPVDFEEVQNLELGLLIENVAPFVEGGAFVMDVDVQVGEGGVVGPGAGAGAGVDVSAEVNAGVDAGVNVGVDASSEVNAGVSAGVEAGANAEVGVQPESKPGPGTQPDTPKKSYPIMISVNNMPEDPAFIPDTKIIPVSEDPNETPTDSVITVFAATDPDTGQPAEDVQYAKAYDPDNWFTVDEETAEIKLSKVPDRESPFLVNGTYVAKILAITKDMPAKTATGTIAIQVTDSNDHCPTLTTSHITLCSNKKTVHVTGRDEDAHPNGAPFTFRIVPEGTRGSWTMEVINDMSAALHSQESLWPGSYELQVEVLDNQGLSCPANEVLHVAVCTCVKTETCRPRAERLHSTSSELAAPAIGLLLLAMCLLLLIPLLILFCQCGGKKTVFPDQFNDLPFDAKQHLISYNTEGKGEDKAVPLQSVPIMLGGQNQFETTQDLNFQEQRFFNMESHQTNTFYKESVRKFEENSQSIMEVDAYRFGQQSFDHGSSKELQFRNRALGTQKSTVLFEDMALPDTFLHDYYKQKATCAELEIDGLLEYDFEGQGSSAGSVGCCSLLEPDNDLQFLNDLEFKFKTLANICSPPTLKPPMPDKVIDSDLVIKTQPVHTVETKHADVNTEKVVSSVEVLKSSEPPSMKITQSEVTNISQSSNIHHTATLPSPVQTVVLQQQPVYYATSPMLQPMHYVVQPQLQTTVLLADGAHGANLPGLYVVSGSQTPSGVPINVPTASVSGLVMHGFESSTIPASPTRLVGPSQLLPGSINVPQGSLPAEGWKVVGTNPNGNYKLVKKKHKKSSSSMTEPVSPGSSKGTLPKGAVLVKEAASPQGILSTAAERSVYGILPGHTVAQNRGVFAGNRSGQMWGGQIEWTGLGPVTILGVGVGQPSVAGMWPAGISTVGVEQISVNQFQGISSSGQAMDTTGVPKASSFDSQKENKTINTENNVTPAEIINNYLLTEKEVQVRIVFKDSSNPLLKMTDGTTEESQSDDVVTFTSQQDTTGDDLSESVHVDLKNNLGIKENVTQVSEKSPDVHLNEAIMNSLIELDVLHESFDESNTVVKKPADTTNEIVPEITDVDANKRPNKMSQTTELSNHQENHKQRGNHTVSEVIFVEDNPIIRQKSVLHGSTVITFCRDKEKEEMSKCEHKQHSTANIVKMDVPEENQGRTEGELLMKEVETTVQPGTVEVPHNRSSEVESEPQSNVSTRDQRKGEQEGDFSAAEKIILDREENRDIFICDYIQKDDKLLEMTFDTGDAHEVRSIEQEQLFVSEVGFCTEGDDETSANPSNEISENTEEQFASAQEEVLELWHNLENGHAKTDIADAEEKTQFPTMFANYEEGDVGDINLTSEEIATQVSEKSIASTLEPTAEARSSGHKEDDDEQNSTSGLGEDMNQVNTDGDCLNNNEMEILKQEFSSEVFQ